MRARTDSPALYLGAWVVTAVLTLIAALSYGELAAMMPKAGGQYVYLRESLGPVWGFLYGWTLFLVIQTGTIAAVCVAFGKFLGVFFPSVSTSHWLWHIAHVPPIRVGPMVLGNMEIGLNTANLVAIVIVFLLAFVNIFGVRLGALIQNVFTSAKALSLAGLVVVGLVLGRNDGAWNANFGPGWTNFWQNAGWHSLHPVQVGVGGPIVLVNVFVILAVVQVGSLFSSDAWNNITFTAGEVKNPRRNIPLSLVLGTGFVLTVYFLASLVYILVLPMHGDPQGATAHGSRSAARHRGSHCHRGALADLPLRRRTTDGRGHSYLHLRLRQRPHARRRARLLRHEPRWPVLQGSWQAPSASTTRRLPALAVQALWTALLCLSGTYSQLLDYIMFAVILFYILTILGLFVLRFKWPAAPRPYRALGYPVLPALYIVMAGWICIVLLRYKPQYTWPGFVLVLLGIPVYFLWSRRSPDPSGERDAAKLDSGTYSNSASGGVLVDHKTVHKPLEAGAAPPGAGRLIPRRMRMC